MSKVSDGVSPCGPSSAFSSDDGTSVVYGCNALIIHTMSVSFLLVVCFHALVLKGGLLSTISRVAQGSSIDTRFLGEW
jgi:hypothetical protein